MVYLDAVQWPQIRVWHWFALFRHKYYGFTSKRDSGEKCQLHQPCRAVVGRSQLGIGCGSPHSVMQGNGQRTWQAVLLLSMLPECSRLQVCHFKRREGVIVSVGNGWPLSADKQLPQMVCIVKICMTNIKKWCLLKRNHLLEKGKSETLCKWCWNHIGRRNVAEKKGERELEG